MSDKTSFYRPKDEGTQSPIRDEHFYCFATDVRKPRTLRKVCAFITCPYYKCVCMN